MGNCIMTLTPTAEQAEILRFVTEETGNLIVEARAGAAKTSTLVMIAEALPKTQIMCLAFNKKIATEMSERLPDNCEAKTLNGLGHRAWGQFLRKKLTLDDKKVYKLLIEFAEKLHDKEEQDEARETFAENLAAVRHGKNCGWIPSRYKGYWKSLMSDDTFFSTLDNEPTELQRDLITAVTQKSMQMALQGTIDFNDQILCPAICPVNFDPVDLVLVDEAQDLSHLNHVTLSKLVKRNRIIAVGDPCQAIYAFRGAASDSMEQLTKRFSMQTRYLTICFRCSAAVVENAMWRAPDMQYPSTAVLGEVFHHGPWSTSLINDSTAVLCRNNAPLFRLGIQLLAGGKLPEIAGRDVAYQLVKIMKKVGKKTLSRDAATRQLQLWKEKELERSRYPAMVKDRAECIQIFIDCTETLGDAIAYLETLCNQRGRIQLMTGHKAKGLEFDEVFILDVKLCKKGKDQDDNIRYVMETRAKRNLHYITSDAVGEVV